MSEKSTAYDYCKKITNIIPTNKRGEFVNLISKGILSQIQTKKLESSIVLPLVVNKSDKEGGDFINSPLNCDQSSYRSPWTNRYFPDIESSVYPSNEIRELEVVLNKKMKEYAKFYYGKNVVTSVYIYESGDSIKKGFHINILFKNEMSDNKELNKGCYDSSILITVKFENLKIEDEKKQNGALIGLPEEEITHLRKNNPENEESADNNYILFANFNCTFNLLFSITPKCGIGEFHGVLTRKEDLKNPITSYFDNEFYVEKIGELVENIETEMREELIYVKLDKTKYILNNIRKNQTDIKNNTDNVLLRELFEENSRNILADNSDKFGQILARKSKHSIKK